jgi:hypothetical protein
VCSALTLVASVALAGCAAPPSESPGKGTARCSVQAHDPHESYGTPGTITGKVDVSCRPEIDSLTGYAKLQKRRGDAWVDVAQADREVLGPKSGRKYTITAAVVCQAGTFRTAGRGEGYLDGTRSGSAAWTYSKAVKNPC